MSPYGDSAACGGSTKTQRSTAVYGQRTIRFTGYVTIAACNSWAMHHYGNVASDHVNHDHGDHM